MPASRARIGALGLGSALVVMALSSILHDRPDPDGPQFAAASNAPPQEVAPVWEAGADR